jgi:hypothetical protein
MSGTERQEPRHPSMRSDRHVSIGDLRRSGGLLEFACSHCGARRLFHPSHLPFGDLQPIVTAHRRMNCSSCGLMGDGSFTRAREQADASNGDVVDIGHFSAVTR